MARERSASRGRFEEVLPILRSALAAEEQTERFTRAAGWRPQA